MNLTAKAAILALVTLMAFQATVTTTYADDRRDNDEQVQGDNGNDDDNIGRKKPKFQTKFFSED